jgi:hypothetical protein
VKPEIEEDELDELDDEPAQASSVKEPARGARSRRGTGAPAKRRSTGGTARRASGRSSRGVKRERELELERDLAASAPQSPRDHDDY